jgi:hypothetical protein
MLIFRASTVLSDIWVERLKNFAASQGIKEPIRVSIPEPVASGEV